MCTLLAVLMNSPVSSELDGLQVELPPELRPGIVRPPRRARPGVPAAAAQAPGGETADTIMREVPPRTSSLSRLQNCRQGQMV